METKLEPLYAKIPFDVMTALRAKMAAERRTQKEIVIQALKQYLGLEQVT